LSVFLILCLFPVLFALQAKADVTVTFYSHDFGNNFPHAFLVVQGTLTDNTEIDENFGFTARKITPKILLGSVRGAIKAAKSGYIRKSDVQFSITVNDLEYKKLQILTDQWRNLPGRSYSLNKQNCVHFIGEVLTMLGYKVNADSRFFKKPKSFLREVKALNPALQMLQMEVLPDVIPTTP